MSDLTRLGKSQLQPDPAVWPVVPNPEPERLEHQLDAANSAMAAAADAETAGLIDAMAEDAANCLWEEADEHWCCPFVPTVATRVERLVDFLGLGSMDTLLDIGCGEGHVLVLAAQRTGCQCIGIDIDGSLLNTAQQAAVAAGVDDRCTWLRCDFRSAEAKAAMAMASAICIFMVPSALRLLVPTLAAHINTRRIEEHPATQTGSGRPTSDACTPALRVATIVYHFENCSATSGLDTVKEDATWKLRMYGVSTK